MPRHKSNYNAMHKAVDGKALAFVGDEAADWISPSCCCSLIYIRKDFKGGK